MNVQDIVSKDYIKVDINDTLSKFIGKAIKHEDDDALIFDKKDFKGVLKRQWLLQSNIDSSKTKVKKFLAHVSTLKPDTDLKKAAELMYNSDSRILPVKDNGKVIGVVKSIDMMKLIKGDLKARQVGTMKEILVDINARYGDVLNLMKENKIGRVPITENKQLVGIVTLKQWMKKYVMRPINNDFGVKMTGTKVKTGTREFKELKNVLDLPIQDMMRISDLVTADPDASVTEISKMMTRKQVPSVVLVKNNKPVGLITIRDMLRFFVTQG